MVSILTQHQEGSGNNSVSYKTHTSVPNSNGSIFDILKHLRQQLCSRKEPELQSKQPLYTTKNKIAVDNQKYISVPTCFVLKFCTNVFFTQMEKFFRVGTKNKVGSAHQNQTYFIFYLTTNKYYSSLLVNTPECNIIPNIKLY